MNIRETAEFLKKADNILVLSHASPDGDTLGSACALIRGLEAMGRRTAFECGDEIAHKYAYLFEGLELDAGEIETIVSVDVADISLLGKPGEKYVGKIDLAIDHHGTHAAFARRTLVEPKAAATAEIVYLLLREMGTVITPQTADCLFTGLTTDTGCFKYSNVTPRTHRIAAELMEFGARAAEINTKMFETKPRELVEAERMALDSMEFYLGGRCAMIYITREMMEKTGVRESDMEGISALPRQIEGVKFGITVKEKPADEIKVSVRANLEVNAAELCETLGGGGHRGAAGCSLGKIGLQAARDKMIAACEKYFAEHQEAK